MFFLFFSLYFLCFLTDSFSFLHCITPIQSNKVFYSKILAMDSFKSEEDTLGAKADDSLEVKSEASVDVRSEEDLVDEGIEEGTSDASSDGKKVTVYYFYIFILFFFCYFIMQ